MDIKEIIVSLVSCGDQDEDDDDEDEDWDEEQEDEEEEEPVSTSPEPTGSKKCFERTSLPFIGRDAD